jgi:hypothetical protein
VRASIVNLKRLDRYERRAQTRMILTLAAACLHNLRERSCKTNPRSGLTLAGAD